MKRTMLNLVGLLLVVGGFAAYGGQDEGYAMDFGNGKRLTLGVDAQLRWEYYDREAYYGQNMAFNGPAVQYLRVRERVWGKLELGAPETYIYARLANRWHYTTSREDVNNNGVATWDFPGEVVLDNLYLHMGNLADVDGLSLRLGRQDIKLGNGMVVAEGTPLDGGRTVYFDGLVATYETEQDTLKFLALYNAQRDDFVVANDDNRLLRYGDTYLAGPYWTHRFSKAFNMDLYYLYSLYSQVNNIGGSQDDLMTSTPGIRLFGSPHKQIDYSLEWAHQFGRLTHNYKTEADMVDARLSFKAPEGICLDPKLSLEYTYFSGDDVGSVTSEAWAPLFDGYPIWREELSVQGIFPRATWSDLHQYRVQLDLLLNPADEAGKNKLTFSTAFAVMQSDVDSAATGGDTYGNLLSAFLDYTVNKNLNFSLQLAQFYPGNYYAAGDTTEWVRLETNIKF